MKLVSFTLAASSLLIAGASLLRQHSLSQRIASLELRIAATPPPVVIRFEEPPSPPVATFVPPAPPAVKRPTQHHARGATTPPVKLAECDPTDSICGIDKRRER